MSEPRAAIEAGSGDIAPPARSVTSPAWRWLATLLLLVTTLPVFALAAVATLPVLLVVAGGAVLRQLAHARATRAVPLC